MGHCAVRPACLPLCATVDFPRQLLTEFAARLSTAPPSTEWQTWRAHRWAILARHPRPPWNSILATNSLPSFSRAPWRAGAPTTESCAADLAGGNSPQIVAAKPCRLLRCPPHVSSTGPKHPLRLSTEAIFFSHHCRLQRTSPNRERDWGALRVELGGTGEWWPGRDPRASCGRRAHALVVDESCACTWHRQLLVGDWDHRGSAPRRG